MKTAFRPFRKPSVNPDATGKLDAAMAYLSASGFPAGETLAGFARLYGVEPRSLRWRCTRAGITTPAAREAAEGAGRVATAEAITEAAEAITEGATVATAEAMTGSPGVELDKLIEGDGETAGEKVKEGCNFPIVYNPPGLDRSQVPVLQEGEVTRHDEEIARLVRDSLEAFRKGKGKGPGGRRVIPIQKVSDLTALDTLFRRATRQGERAGEGGARPILNIQFLGAASRESVRVAKDDTSPLLDVSGEESETRPR